MTHSAIDRCDVLDLLEEAAVARRSVEVELRDGRSFVDGVRDVVTENGRDYVVFERHLRLPVAEIARCGRTPDGPRDGNR